MIDTVTKEKKKDVGCITVFKTKIRALIEAINAGKTAEEIKAELERMIS